MLRVKNEPTRVPPTIDLNAGSAASWNSYFAAPLTGRQEKDGTAFTPAPSAGVT